MIVCVCNNISSKKIEDVLFEKELKSIRQLQKEMSVCNDCKCCAATIQNMIYSCDMPKAA